MERISRRSLLRATGAVVGGGVAMGLGPPSAFASEAEPPGAGQAPGMPTVRAAGEANPGIVAAVAPAINPAWSYRVFGYSSFHSQVPVSTSVDGNGLHAASDATFAAPLDLPQGAVIREATFWVYNSSPSTGLGVGFANLTPPSSFTGGSFAFSGANQGPHTVTINSFLGSPIDNTARGYHLQSFLTGGATFGLLGARIAWENGYLLSGVQPQVRKLDTRNPGPNSGKISSGQQKTVALTPQLPAGAKLAVLSLTVTDTVAAGFLGLFPGGTSWPGTSNINWFANGQTLATNVIVPVSSTGTVTMRCQGPGATHVIVDLIGYYQ
jgi:hypothetical protein